MVTLWNDDSRADALALAGELRRGGLRVDVYPEADKLGKQFKYASSRHVPFVAIVGDDERAERHRERQGSAQRRAGDRAARRDAAAFIAACVELVNLEP